MAEIGLTKNKIVTELVRSAHGDLKGYLTVGKAAAKEDPQFMAHLLSWNALKGQVRDAKVALPLIALTVTDLDAELVENAFAHLSMLGPREMLKAYHFALDNPLLGRMSHLRRIFTGKLLQNERNWPKWERTLLQHRETMRSLFSLLHIAPQDERTDACLFKRKGEKKLVYPAGGLFEAVSHLRTMSPLEAAGTILQRKIPFLIAAGALGKNTSEPDLVMALIKNMTATELVTNTKMLERMGVKTNPVLRGAFQEALAKAGSSTANLLKATTAAENIDDDDLKQNLQDLQEKQLKKVAGIDGNWLVLADKSGSMSASITLGREVAATLAKMVKGTVWLVFFDTVPHTIDVTGMTLDQIKEKTRHIRADGGTSIGCGLLRMCDAGTQIDGIAIVSDGGDNTTPQFVQAYERYSKVFDKEPPVYFYMVRGSDPAVLIPNMERAKHDLQVFDLTGTLGLDAYSLPNLVQTMRTNRYSLIEEIMETRLLKLPDALKNFRKEERANA